MATQQLIDKLILFIEQTEDPASVTNVMVATILDYLNRSNVYVNNAVDDLRQLLPENLEDWVNQAKTMLKDSQDALNILDKALANLLENIRVTIVDRGPYDQNAYYLFETLNPDTGRVETHDAWLAGCRYRCLVSGTSQVPGWNASDWMFIEGNPEFRVDFEPVNTFFKVNSIDMPLSVVATLYNQDVTADVRDADVVWTRYSEDADGVPRVLSDTNWAMTHVGRGKKLRITTADIDWSGGRLPKKIIFTATVTLRSGDESLTAAAELPVFDIS